MRVRPSQSSYRESIEELTEFIHDQHKRKQLVHLGGANENEIKDFEHLFTVRLPEEFRLFLASFGGLKASNGVVIFGIGDTGGTEPSLEEVTFRVRMEQPFPRDLVP